MKLLKKFSAIATAVAFSSIMPIAFLSEAAGIENDKYWGKYEATVYSYFTASQGDVVMNCVKFIDNGTQRYLSANNAQTTYMTDYRFSASYSSYYKSDAYGNNITRVLEGMTITADDVEVIPNFFNEPIQVNIYYHDLCYMKPYGNTL